MERLKPLDPRMLAILDINNWCKPVLAEGRENKCQNKA